MLALSHIVLTEQGKDTSTAIAAAAILDSEGLTVSEDFGIQKNKNPIVDKAILCDVTKV
jgi:hypothetical protein